MGYERRHASIAFIGRIELFIQRQGKIQTRSTATDVRAGQNAEYVPLRFSRFVHICTSIRFVQDLPSVKCRWEPAKHVRHAQVHLSVPVVRRGIKYHLMSNEISCVL